MADSEFHLESLRERARAGTVAEHERVRLEQHTRECLSCAFEEVIHERSRALPDDAALLESTVGSALASATLESRSAASPLGRRWLLRFAVAAMVLLSAGVSGALVAQWWNVSQAPVVAPATPSVAVARPLAPAPRTTASAQAEADAAPAPVPDGSANLVPITRSAPDLLAEANRLRRSDPGAAARVYGELQRQHPSSSEALVSCVSLGRLYLNRLGSPAAALAQFEVYLRAAPGGSLAHEALVGRALALQRLGRRGDEIRAWQQLLDRYPDSMHGDWARQRIAGTASPPGSATR